MSLFNQPFVNKYAVNNTIKEEKIKAVLVMSVTVNHELNLPLIMIQGNLELLS